MTNVAVTAAFYSAISTEFATRDYLRTVPAVLAAVGGDSRKIDLDYNGDVKVTRLVMYRAGGSPAALLPMDRALLTFHCWGSTRRTAEVLRVALVQALVSLGSTPLNDTVYGYGATVESSTYLPSTEGVPRYVVTSLVTARSRQVAPAS